MAHEHKAETPGPLVGPVARIASAAPATNQSQLQLYREAFGQASPAAAALSKDELLPVNIERAELSHGPDARTGCRAGKSGWRDISCRSKLQAEG